MMIRKQTLMPNMAFDVFCIFWQKCEATKGSQCPAGYSHNRASIYIMTGRDMLLPRIRLFARTPKVASSREAAQSQSRRWLIEVFSFLEIDSFTIFKPKKGFHFFTTMLSSPSLPRWSCLSSWPVASDANDDQAVQQDANQSNLWMKRAIWSGNLIFHL